MGLFNFNRNKNQSNSDEQGSRSPERHAQPYNQSAGHEAIQQAEAAKKETERQEDKLIRAFMQNPEAGLFSAHRVQVGKAEREDFYQKVASGEISALEESEVLQNIATPLDVGVPHQQVLAGMQDKHERRILAEMSGTGFDNWQYVNPNALSATMAKYPTPVEFAPAEEEMLEAIRLHNSPAKYQEYREAMESFKQKFYGKRYEYHKAFQSLQGKAEQFTQAQTAREHVLSTYHKTTVPTEIIDDTELMDDTEVMEQLPQPPVQVERLSKKEIKSYLKQGKIEGDTYIYNGQEYQLTTKNLEKLGLTPEYGIKFEGIEIGFSKTFAVDEGHMAAIAYVRSKDARGKDRVKICSYYRSNSQGMWRYMPDYTIQQEATDPVADIAWFGKGYDEDSLNLPIQTQYALDTINLQPHAEGLDRVNAHFAFAGTAHRYQNFDEYRKRRREGTLLGDHYREVKRSANYNWNLGNHYDAQKPPETLDLEGFKSPDFSKLAYSYQKDAGINGLVQVECFPSQRQECMFAFNQDQQGRAWLGSIEITKAPLSSNGLRTEWASAGDYATPLYEYESQVESQYYDRTSSDRKGSYVCMWSKYLSKMPLIKRYLNSQRHRR